MRDGWGNGGRGGTRAPRACSNRISSSLQQPLRHTVALTGRWHDSSRLGGRLGSGDGRASKAVLPAVKASRANLGPERGTHHSPDGPPAQVSSASCSRQAGGVEQENCGRGAARRP